MSSVSTILLTDYMKEIEGTDTLGGDIQPVAMGLFGEVGSIMAAAKKRRRDKSAYVGYHRALEEEFGDTLWYFAALCRRLDVPFEDVFLQCAHGDDFDRFVAASDVGTGAISDIRMAKSVPELGDALVVLGKVATDLLDIERTSDIAGVFRAFSHAYLRALHASGVTFSKVAHGNIGKARGRFGKLDEENLPEFDCDFPKDEQLPREFEIVISKRGKRTYMKWNDVFIGDPLTDNIGEADGYRFHDVFHLAHAAILHWSPVFRALIKHKRKSRRDIDEAITRY